MRSISSCFLLGVTLTLAGPGCSEAEPTKAEPPRATEKAERKATWIVYTLPG